MENKKYDIQATNKFKKQYKKFLKKPDFKKSELEKVIDIIANNKSLPKKYHNHLLNPTSKRNLGMSCTARCFIRISKN